MSDKLNNYNLMKMLCSKLSRKQIIEDLSIKCEELYLAREGILKKDNEIERLKGNWNTLREWLDRQREGYQHAWIDMSVILNKMNELERNDNNEYRI